MLEGVPEDMLEGRTYISASCGTKLVGRLGADHALDLLILVVVLSVVGVGHLG